ncbi:hypothetical protein E2C01_005778 [Portunus trituberculatus]|uniref:Uncharacterized protein n=1 Tax=Portunus trituberculatus TaxID=210409 RepID=A0A5B7CUD2_PORTR|nr:hypothetical protein [Portunus trituberculatus]
MKNYRQNAEECCFVNTAAGLEMHTSNQDTGITSNTASERYSGGCKKGDDRALYTTKCVAV